MLHYHNSSKHDEQVKNRQELASTIDAHALGSSGLLSESSLLFTTLALIRTPRHIACAQCEWRNM
jgi:hypothetical protein